MFNIFKLNYGQHIIIFFLFSNKNQRRFQWAPHDTPLIKKKFESRAGEWLKQTFKRVRATLVKPAWVNINKWPLMLERWNSQKFKKLCEINKKNRHADAASATTYWRGGSVSMLAHKRKMVSLISALS